ncbi:MAG TPA: hypothetical protein VK518_06795 [Puia sp.]|nr:hypothetical protein [Puia sp.]
MQTFKIAESSYKKIRKRLYIATAISIVVGCFIAMLTTSHGSIGFNVSSLSFMIPYLAVVIGLSFFSVFRRQKKILHTYSVTISDTGITQEQASVPSLTISFMEIKEIVKTKRGAFIIKGLQRRDIILIPYGIENKDELETRLAELAPISSKSQDPIYQHYRSFLSIGAFVMLLCANAVTNKVLAGIAGVLSIGLYIWAFYEIQTNNNISDGRKKRSYLYFLYIILVLATMYTKLVGFGY